MEERPAFEDQRQSKRFLVRENSYVLLKQPQYKELGKIIDISETGIAFHCINQGDWTDTSFEIDIFLADELELAPHEQNIIKSIPLRPVAYCKERDDEVAQDDAMMTRCGVSFGVLSPDQKFRIKQFIAHHTVGNA